MVVKRKISKVLIANRGEIACRVIRTCKDLGIETVAVYSEPDRNSMFAKQADEAYCIGAAKASESYLNMQKIVNVCKRSGADAVHPGYGFLSENAEFADLCKDNGIIFIGPKAASMAMVGDKRSVKTMLQENKSNDVPLIPGYNGADQTTPTLVREAKRIGCPVLVKASAGGGGKGMRVVYNVDDIEETLDSVKREALSSFGSDQVLLEKYFIDVHHVEIQIFGDEYGDVIALGERECSVQRRYQKVVEESPSPILTENLRTRMCNSAIAIGKLSGYVGAGTVEFLVDHEGAYYFLEVNTRLQVEHPITECVYNVDLVQWQLQVAMGYPLSSLLLKNGEPSNKMKRNGHAIEVRLYAEDPKKNYFPCTGEMIHFAPYHMKHLRFDTGIESGSDISVDYDPMLAKVISFGVTREEAIQRMIKALQSTVIAGPVNNNLFLIQCLKDSDFYKGEYSTSFIPKRFPQNQMVAKLAPPPELKEDMLVACMLAEWHIRKEERRVLNSIPPGFTNGYGAGRAAREQKSLYTYKNESDVNMLRYRHNARQKQDFSTLTHTAADDFVVKLSKGKNVPTKETGAEKNVSLLGVHVNTLPTHTRVCTVVCEIDNLRREFVVVFPPAHRLCTDIYVHQNSYGTMHVQNYSSLSSSSENKGAGGPIVRAPMPSKIVEVIVKPGATVKPKQVLVVLESMKMEMKVLSHASGTVKSINCKAGQVVKEGDVLITLNIKDSKL